MGSLDTPAQLSQQTQFSTKSKSQFSTKRNSQITTKRKTQFSAKRKSQLSTNRKSVQKSFKLSSLSSSPLLHSPFSLDLLQKDVALTGTALDSGEPLARAGDPISSSSSRLAAGRGHTLCLGSVTWCLIRCVT